MYDHVMNLFLRCARTGQNEGMRVGLLYTLMATLLALTPSCRSFEQQTWEPGSEEPPVAAVYLLREGDVLEFALPQDISLNGSSIVRSDGMATLPLVGDVPVGGLSISQAHAVITDRMAEHLVEPQVLISLKSTRDREIYISGEVRTPGSISYQDELTVLDALLRAGGPLKASADLENVILVRTESGGERLAWRMDFSDILTTANPPRAVNLLPGDIVLVPNTTIDRANIAIEKYITRMIPGGAVLQRFLVGDLNN